MNSETGEAGVEQNLIMYLGLEISVDLEGYEMYILNTVEDSPLI